MDGKSHDASMFLSVALFMTGEWTCLVEVAADLIPRL